MKDKLKTEGVSILITFISSFLLALGASIQATGGIEWSTSMLMALIVAGARAGVKAVIERHALKMVGAPKK